MSDNSYKLVVARMPDEDLLAALKANESMYLDEMLLAVLDECEKRKLPFPGASVLRARISDRYVAEVEKFEAEAVVQDIVVPLPVFYSQTVILAFTIFFSPLFGGIMLAMNVWKVNKKSVWQVIVFSVVFTAFSGYVSYYMAPGSFVAILIPISGALILSELLWNRFIGKGVAYDKRKITIPLIIALLITLPIVYYVYMHPELMEFAKN